MTSNQRFFPIVEHANVANAITAANALLGVVGLYCAARGLVFPALFCAALAMPCDILDGVVARKMGTSSAFGGQLDTLADAVSFVLLPGSIAIAMAMPAHTLVAALFFTMTGLLRLARFGVVGTTHSSGKAYFEGVPTIFAASTLQVVVPVSSKIPSDLRPLVFTAFYLFFALAMVSRIPFPKVGWPSRLMWVLVPVALVFTWLVFPQ